MRYYENCKYYWNATFHCAGYYYRPEHYHHCYHPLNIDTLDTAISRKASFLNYADEINKDNHCKNYKRKWYKFWIKGDQ